MAKSDTSYNIRQALKAAHDKPTQFYGKQLDLVKGRKVAAEKTKQRFIIFNLLRKLGL